MPGRGDFMREGVERRKLGAYSQNTVRFWNGVRRRRKNVQVHTPRGVLRPLGTNRVLEEVHQVKEHSLLPTESFTSPHSLPPPGNLPPLLH